MSWKTQRKEEAQRGCMREFNEGVEDIQQKKTQGEFEKTTKQGSRAERFDL
jgi:hypothetical protein